MGMHAPQRSARVSIAFCIVVALSARVAAGSQWIGGHSENWSDPLNWMGGVPVNGGGAFLHLDQSIPARIVQVITGGVAVSVVISAQGVPLERFLIDGNRIDLTPGGM